MTRLRAALLALTLCLGPAGPAFAADQPTDRALPQADVPWRIYIATWRGCEEVCEAFRDYLIRRGLNVDFLVKSAERDVDAIPAMVEEARQLRPDLIATWGTGITLAFVGPYDGIDPERHITDIPVVFMYVSDPVGSKIAVSPEGSGRRMVAGAHYAVPADSQIKAMQSYRDIDRLAMIYNPAEDNSVGAYEQMRRTTLHNDIALIGRPLNLDDNNNPIDEDLAAAVAEVAAEEPDFLVFGSSSYLISNVERFTELSVAHGVPVFSIGEKVLRDAQGLLGLIATLRNIGQVSAYQAERILRDGITPGDLPSAHLSRFLLMVNMPVARELSLYPPMSVVQFAEFLTEPHLTVEPGQ